MFYAKFSRRGFANEYDVLAFARRADRDRFVQSVPRTSYSAGYNAYVQVDNNSAWAEAITARAAASLLSNDLRNRITKDQRNLGGARPLTLAEYFGADVAQRVDEHGFIDWGDTASEAAARA